MSAQASERVDATDSPAPKSLDRWTISPAAAAFLRERAERLRTEPGTILEDLILVERRRCEGAI